MASTEAQKLVHVSLSKIAASRATRTGINLYKSLMVSSVLYKARTIVIMEKYNGPFTDYEKSESSVDSADDQDCDENKDIQTTDIDDYDFDDETEDDVTCENQTDTAQGSDETNTSIEKESEDKENINNQDNQTQGKTSLNANVTTNNTSNCQVLKSCENTTQNLDNNEIIKCERCVKRRYSDVESTVDNVSSSKKMKNDEDNNVVVETSENNNAKEQPMDGVQITQLVDSFTSGFTGLISQGGCTNTNINNKSTTNVLQVNDQNNRNTTSSKSHGLSEAFNHCSTQIKESFETLASPIMALGITA